MSETPSPKPKPDMNPFGKVNRQSLSRATLLAAVIAVGGIALFFILWVVLADLNQFARLMLSLCVPPGVMAAVVGGYLLLVQPKRNDKD